MMTDEEATQWDRLIRRAVRFVTSDFPDVSYEDLVQDMWCHVLESPGLDPNINGVSTFLTKRARKMAWDIRTDQLYHSDQYSYRTSDVRRLLEDVFDYELWNGGWVPEDARSDGDAMAPVELRADVKAAFTFLLPQYQSAIIARYQLGIEPAPESSQRRTLDRAVQRLTRLMNTHYNRRPRRRVISNAEAASIIEGQT